MLLAALTVVQAFRRATSRIASDFFYPFVRVSGFAEDALSNKSLLLEKKLSLAAALEKLQKENSRLLAQTAALEILHKENSELRNLMKIAQPSAAWNCIFAEVLVRDPVFWEENFTINKGSESGLVPGALVLACVADADNATPLPVVAGRLSSVSKHSAVVSTVISKDCVLSVRVPASGASGIMQGGVRDGGRCKVSVRYLPRSLLYEPGQYLYTSGLSRWTPPGIRVGTLYGDKTVEGVFQDNLHWELKMEPAVKLDDLHFVMVMVAQ